MSHDLEEGANGEVAFASLREVAWHGLGTVLEDEVTTSEMLKAAHLSGWDVRFADVNVGTDARFVVPAQAVVRTNPFDGGLDVLGIVGERYTIVQNEDAFTFADAILDGNRWETAGSIKGGRVVFGSLALDRETVLDPSGAADKIESYLLIHTSHDGSTPVMAAITPVRVVCQNTLNFALKGIKQSFKVRHTQTVDGKVAAAREALGLAHKYLDAFEVEAQAMIEAELTKDQFVKIISGLFPEPKEGSKAAATRRDAKVEALLSTWAGPTQENISGTAWAALNALTEHNQWERNIRAGNAENFYAAGAGFDLVTNEFRNKARSAVLAAIA